MSKEMITDRYIKFVLSVHPEDKYPAQLIAILNIFDVYLTLWVWIQEEGT